MPGPIPVSIFDDGATLTPSQISAYQTQLRQAFLYFRLQGVNFNLPNNDNPLNIVLPVGFTRYRIPTIRIMNPSGTLTTATCTIFSGAGGTGIALIGNPSTITITTNADNTNNNLQTMGGTNTNTMSITPTTIFFRTLTPQGVAATADVLVEVEPLF